MQRGLFVVLLFLLPGPLACESRSGETKVIGETKPNEERSEEENGSQRQGYPGGYEPSRDAEPRRRESRTPAGQKDESEASASSQGEQGNDGATRSSAGERREGEDSEASNDTESEKNDNVKINDEASQEKDGDETDGKADQDEGDNGGETERYKEMIGDWDGTGDDPPKGFRFEVPAP